MLFIFVLSFAKLNCGRSDFIKIGQTGCTTMECLEENLTRRCLSTFNAFRQSLCDTKAKRADNTLEKRQVNSQCIGLHISAVIFGLLLSLGFLVGFGLKYYSTEHTLRLAERTRNTNCNWGLYCTEGVPMVHFVQVGKDLFEDLDLIDQRLGIPNDGLEAVVFDYLELTKKDCDACEEKKVCEIRNLGDAGSDGKKVCRELYNEHEDKWYASKKWIAGIVVGAVAFGATVCGACAIGPHLGS